MTHARALVALLATLLVTLAALSACSAEPQGKNVDPEQVDST